MSDLHLPPSPPDGKKDKVKAPGEPLRRGDACLMCRGKKLKCSATKPVCDECAKRKYHCVYDAVRPASRVEKLEKKLAELEEAELREALARRHSAIFLSTRIVGVPHVPEEDRYIINKVRSLRGFYGVTLRVGYLDSRTPSLPALLPYLTSIEARGSASPAPVIDALTAAAHHATHFIPSYTVISRRSGWVPWVWVRRILIEEIYGRARVIFPDYVAAPDAMQDDTIHVAVSAVI
ncbi:hypothetical protein EHS25_005590 [Saitozyma podzolica]|uniref:Zn(2)-C6 fungal-type domain-containing protein n=1 Tax=Saitozyma podzolica TaxID=1890683 RepID=A0A427XXT0_9TREE|nr:hypothetical protein EHS25_005590 [Saitozyma podzolica]